TTLLAKLLDRSKISLCFEPSYIERFQGYSPILLRWFEGWASGCTIVGRRPFGQGVADLMDWKNSTIELPENSADWIPFFEDLLGDEEAIAANARRNYRECLLRHDWRYRLRDLFNLLELPVPEKLNFGIANLKQKLDNTAALSPEAKLI
ncbi:MAG: glycosyltransferase family 1 protein, partial [Microcoleus sp. SIO2G3]|nr:glycosyltransferase family 1 protein [Microcoleus sp. SIO2G3]